MEEDEFRMLAGRKEERGYTINTLANTAHMVAAAVAEKEVESAPPP